MLKQIVLIVFLSVSTTFFGQITQKTDSLKKPEILQVQDTVKTAEKELVILKAIVVSDNISKPLQNANIIDLDNLNGISSDENGKFSIEVLIGDRLLISYLGYESIQLIVTQDMIDIVNSKIIMRVKPFEIAEVTVSSYKLVGVLETDSKFIPTHTAYDIDTRGIPNQNVKLKRYDASRVINNPLNAIYHPVDFLYSMFGSKPKQMRKLRKMKEQSPLSFVII